MCIRDRDKKDHQAGAAVGGEEACRDRLLPHPVSDWTRVFSILLEESWKGLVTRVPVLHGSCGRCQQYILLFCDRLEQHRRSVRDDIKQEISPDNTAEAMIQGEDAWNCVERFAEEILRAKKIDLGNTT